MKRLYVADDDPAILNLMKISLRSLPDVEATFFEDGLALYRAVHASRPDAVVTDIMLPKLEGVAVARLLKFDEPFQDLPILVISSVMDPDVAEQVKSVRADDFLRKPFRPQEIRDRVAALLEKVPASV